MTDTPKPVVDLYSAEFGDDLNGEEELSIRKAFGSSLDDLAAQGGYDGVRALIYAHRRREGDNARDAKAYAMQMRRADVFTYFAGLGNPPDGETPEHEGKG